MKYFFKTFIALIVCALPFFAVGQADDNNIDGATQNQTHQHGPWCGTIFNDDDLQSIEQFADYYYHRGGKAEYAAKPRTTKYLPVAYHLVANADGSGRYPLNKALNDLCVMNTDMDHADLQLYLKYDIDLSINNDGWNTATSTTNTLMMQFNNETDAINVYQVNLIRNDPGVAGIAIGSVFHNTAAPNPNTAAILFRKGQGSVDGTGAHEFGHNLSLPHTFFGWEGQTNDYVCGAKAPAWAERYSGVGCSNSGDRLCDTAPDYVTGFPCSGSGTQNTACLQMDADSATGYAEGANIMSYGFGCSPKVFSTDQINAMDWHLTNLRPSFITYTPTTTPITASLTTTEPANGATTDFYDQVTFEWQAVPNATHYAIEINRTATFPENLMVDMAVVTGTSFTSTASFNPNTTYRWRVIPFNEGYFCASPSATRTFQSGDLASSTKTITAVEKMELLPNLAKNGQNVNLVINAEETFDASINIFDLNGRMLSSEQVVFNSGSTVHPINTTGFAAGMYLVAVQSENGVVNKKLIIAE